MKNLLLLMILLLLALAGCDRGEPVNPSTSTPVVYPDPNVGEVKGFFVLNEGAMGGNRSTLDYLDYETGVYTRNIFAERNPGVVRELGDMGNDLQIHDGRLYAVMNGSNLVEVMDAATARHIGVVSIPNCRHIVFGDNHAYVSSFAGPVQVGDPNTRPGYVAKIDLETLRVVDECVVGLQPEEMVIAGDELYVANSGGYNPPDYDNTVSVIDLRTFTETKRIELAVNLHRMELDRYGGVWVSSRGDYGSVPSRTFVIDSRTHEVTHRLDLPCSDMARHGDRLYLYSTEWSNLTGGWTVTYAVVDTESKEIVTRNLIEDGTEGEIVAPYGIAVNPATGEIVVTDARDYVTPGRLHCYSPQGVRKWPDAANPVVTGDIPSRIAFTTQKLQPAGK